MTLSFDSIFFGIGEMESQLLEVEELSYEPQELSLEQLKLEPKRLKLVWLEWISRELESAI